MRERLAVDLGKRAKLEPWEGVFSNGAPFRLIYEGWMISNRYGYASTWSPLDMGRIKVKGDRITLISASRAKPAPPPREYVVVRWGECVFLLRPDRLLGFCNDANSGALQHGIHGWNYLLRESDFGKDVTGLPLVPTDFRKYLLKRPVRATIVSVGSGQVKTAVPGRKELLRGLPLTLNVGQADGIWPGMRFFNPLDRLKDILVVRAEKHTATVIVEDFTSLDRDVYIPGSQLSTLKDAEDDDGLQPEPNAGNSRTRRGAREAAFRGKTLKTYIRDLNAKDDSRRAAAFDFLRYFTPRDQEAFPILLKIAGNTKDYFRSRAVFELGRLGKREAIPVLLERLRDAEPFVRRSAALSLSYFGGDAKAAVPDLLRMVEKDDSMVRPLAALALGEISTDPGRAVPALSRALQAAALEQFNQEPLRDETARALSKFGEAGTSALLEALRGKDANARLVAARVLWEKTHRPEAIAALARSLEAGEPEFREKAATILRDIGVGARPAIPALLRALSDKNERVQLAAAHALANTGKSAVPGLLALLSDMDARLREQAAFTLALEPLEPQLVVPALIKALNDKDGGVRATALGSLGAFGRHAAPAIPALIKALQDKELRDVAVLSLGRLGPEASAAAPALVEMLTSGDADRYLLKTLGAIGPKARPAVPAIIKLLRAENQLLATAAPDALAKIGDAATAVPALIRALESEVVAAEAADALGSFGAKARRVVPALAALLHDPQWHIRNAAVEALGAIGLDSKGAIPALRNALKDPVERIRRHAAETLGKIGSADEKTVQALVATMSDRDRDVRAWAALSHWRLQHRPEMVVPVLTEFLAYTFRLWDGQDFLTAIRCLGEIGPAASEAIPTLRHVLRYGGSWARNDVLEAMRKIERASP